MLLKSNRHNYLEIFVEGCLISNQIFFYSQIALDREPAKTLDYVYNVINFQKIYKDLTVIFIVFLPCHENYQQGFSDIQFIFLNNYLPLPLSYSYFDNQCVDSFS